MTKLAFIAGIALLQACTHATAEKPAPTASPVATKPAPTKRLFSVSIVLPNGTEQAFALALDEVQGRGTMTTTEGFERPVKLERGDDGSFRVNASAINLTITLTPDESAGFDCSLHQGATFPCAADELTLSEFRELTERPRPQTPKPPFPYRVMDVTVPAEPGVLACTLTLPHADNAPGVLLLSGSGAQDRDETLAQHKPFAVWADALTRRGFAVMRCDDRGVGGTTPLPDATTMEFARDAVAAFRWFIAQPSVDSTRVGLMGHSEGGVMAVIAAANEPRVAFVVTLAGPGLPGEAVLMQQNRDIIQASGGSELALATQLARVEALANFANDETLTPKERVEQARAWAHANGLPEGLASPWLLAFVRLDPQPFLKQLRVPVLAINGGRDLQVHAEQNLNAIAQALKESGNDRVTTKIFPALNHLFQRCETGLMSEYGQIETTVEPEVQDYVGDWLTATLKR